MGACGGRECGGGPELSAAGKAHFDAWANGPGKDQSPSKDSAALTAWALLYKKVSHRMLGDEADPSCVVKSIHSVQVVGPAGSHYHFDLDHVHPDFNANSSRSIKWCVVRDAKGDWACETPCRS